MAKQAAQETEVHEDATEGETPVQEAGAEQTAAEAADAPAKETKSEAFTRIAQRRMSNALTAIKTLEGLASTTNYEYTEEQYTKMLGAIRAQADKLEATFQAGGKAKADAGFTF